MLHCCFVKKIRADGCLIRLNTKCGWVVRMGPCGCEANVRYFRLHRPPLTDLMVNHSWGRQIRIGVRSHLYNPTLLTPFAGRSSSIPLGRLNAREKSLYFFIVTFETSDLQPLRRHCVQSYPNYSVNFVPSILEIYVMT